MSRTARVHTDNCVRTVTDIIDDAYEFGYPVILGGVLLVNAPGETDYDAAVRFLNAGYAHCGCA